MTPHDARVLVIIAFVCIALVWLMRDRGYDDEA